MAMLKRATAITAGVEAARRYARNNPEKARSYVDKAARFADQRTKGKYTRQISGLSDKVMDLAVGSHAGNRTVQGGTVRPEHRTR